jgi:L-glyceraldehyde 3-phosphate reductase
VRKLNALDEIARARGQSLAQLALAWVLREQAHGRVASALIGASRPEQIEENLRALGAAPLAGDELSAIESVIAGPS